MSFKLSLKCQIYLFNVEICSFFLFYSIPLLSFSSSQFSSYFLPLSFLYFLSAAVWMKAPRGQESFLVFAFSLKNHQVLEGFRDSIYTHTHTHTHTVSTCWMNAGFVQNLSTPLYLTDWLQRLFSAFRSWQKLLLVISQTFAFNNQA